MRLPRLAPAVCLAVLALTATACGGSTPTSSAPTTPPATSAPATMPATQAPSAQPSPTQATVTPTQAPASATTAPSATAPAAPGSSVDLTAKSLTGIQSPSGHIACLLTDDPVAARCDVQNAHWSAPKPARCTMAYGDSAEVGTRKADLTCHSDTVFGAPDLVTLPYGQSAKYHDLYCTSRTTGITCWNALGHGFTVSRESYKLF